MDDFFTKCAAAESVFCEVPELRLKMNINLIVVYKCDDDGSNSYKQL